VNAGDRLAGAAMRHNAGEALGPDMEALELTSGRVVDDGIGFEHGMITRDCARAAQGGLRNGHRGNPR
jgi:hypothetical protein